MGLIPDEARALPPPGLVNRNTLWFGFMGWCSAILGNALNRRPPLKSGVHRQALAVTLGWFIGYHLSKYENYSVAKQDRELFGYMKQHPEDFPEKGKRTIGEVLDEFHPIR